MLLTFIFIYILHHRVRKKLQTRDKLETFYSEIMFVYNWRVCMYLSGQVIQKERLLVSVTVPL
jgi:hypothetical protein